MRQRNVTSVRAIVLVSVNLKNSIFSFQFWTNHLHRVATSLNRSGWLVWWLCKASLRLSWCPLCVLHCSTMSSHTGPFVRNKVSASLCSRCVHFCFFFFPLIHGFALNVFRHWWPFFWPNVSKSSSNLFLGQSVLNPHVSFWWIFVEQLESCHTDSGLRQWLVSIIIPMIIDCCLMKYINASFSLSLDINVIQKYRKSVLPEHKVSFSEQHGSNMCNFP